MRITRIVAIETILKLPLDARKKAGSQALTAMFSGLGQLNDKGEFTFAQSRSR